MSIATDTKIANISKTYFGDVQQDDNYFQLNSSFLQQYANKHPNFGFNGLGEFVFYRTYSRRIDPTHKETFLLSIKRTVEGCYEIQRRHCRRLHIPWDFDKAQDSAQEMFSRMWEFKFLPPGRGLWMMGTPFMWERGSAALNNCFRSTEKIITRDGIKPIGELVGTTQTLLSSNGKWVDAPIKSFGIQRLWKLTVIRAGVEKHIYTTENHNWFAKSSRRVDLSEERAELLQDTSIRLKKMKGGTKYQTITTAGLKPGMKLRSVFGQGIKGNVRPSTFGIAHGICFGDGTRGHDSTSTSSYIYLCGKKNIELLRYFNDSHTSFDPNKGKEGALRVADIPRFFKESPSYNESKSYLYGWLAGYFAADGHLSKRSGGATITSSQRENLEIVADICTILGISTSPIRISTKILHSGGEIKEFLSYTISLYPYHLRREFFLVSHHRDSFDRLMRKSAFRHNMPNIIQWRVKSVEETDIEEEVYCAQVPEYHTFTLEGNILTGNCGFVSTYDQIESDPAEPFCFLMDMSMLGVGVGFDTKGANRIHTSKPENHKMTYVIADSREGWVDSVRHLIWSYTIRPKAGYIDFDYSQIRPAGTRIRGFGGRASGPDILVELHDLLRSHLDKKIGKMLGSVDIVDLMNYIGRCVVAGNVRRTAEIAFGEADDHDYCSMKNPIASLVPEDLPIWYEVIGKLYNEERYTATLEDFTNELAINMADLQRIPAERLRPAIKTWNCLNHHRWASNNSIFAKVGMDYDKIAQQIAVNGEPGLMWLDNMRDYGRMIDGRQPGIDGRVMGGNPCFTGNMRLLTEQGYVSLYDLWLSSGCDEYQGTDDVLVRYGSQKIINSNGLATASCVYRTGIKQPIYRVMFSDNSWIDATEHHTMIKLVRHASKKRDKTRYEEQRLKLSELRVGDLVPLNQTIHFGDFHDPAYAELAGWCIGDGSLSPKRDGQVRAECTCYEEDAVTVLPKIRGLLHELYITHNRSSNQKPAYAGWVRDQDHFDHREERIGSNVLGRLLKADGVRSGDKHNIPTSIWRGTRDTVAAFLRGLASADGFILINERKGTISARIKQSNNEFLRDCRLLLNQFGISSSVHKRHSNSKQLMNDGKGGKKLYNQKAGYELIVSGIQQVTRFLDYIGFIQESKMIEARKWLSNHLGSNNSNTGRYVKVISVKYCGEEDTYCLTEPNDNRVVIEGYQVGQCLEQSLESYELCVAGDTVLQLRGGACRINDVVGKSVEIWNGDNWSEVTPRVTGKNRKLYRVHLSDGSYLDTTANHGWSVKPTGKRIYRRVDTKDLTPGSKVLSFSLGHISGQYEPNAFEMGYIAGDGYRDTLDRPRWAKSMAVVCGDENKRESLSLNGIQYKPQEKDGYNEEYTRYNLSSAVLVEQTEQLRCIESPIPEWVFEFDRESILEFVAGWIESDGSLVRQPNTDGYRVYGTEPHMRSLQLLLRRVGINHASVNLCHPKGQITNKGIRKYDLWYVQIPSFESGEIPTRYKVAMKIGSRLRPNPRYPDRMIDMAKKQRVVRVEELSGLHTTYCFDEPDNHMGVFGNSITYQCNLVETFPANHDHSDDYMRTLKFAYLYAKTVTLLPTHHARTNAVTLRNRRIGLSQSGIAQAFAKFGRRAVLRDFCDTGYNEIRRWDNIYAEWLCIQPSIKVTSVKPSGTVSLVAGATPGIHYPEASAYWRRVRVAKNSALAQILAQAGYHIEPMVGDEERTVVITFAISDERVRPVNEISIWEQVQNVVDYQRYWADNQVSCTVKFSKNEVSQIKKVLESYEDQLKGISFLPLAEHGYVQAPYEPCTPEEVEKYNATLGLADYTFYVDEATGSNYCDNDRCEIVQGPSN